MVRVTIASIPIHRIIVPSDLSPVPIAASTAAAAFGLASTTTSRCRCPTTASTITRLSTAASLVITLGCRWAYKCVVDRNGLIEQFGAVQGLDSGRGFHLCGIFDEDVALDIRS